MAKKLYYKIGEACKRLEIQPYVLRYWETEFPFLSPNKSKSGQRVYSDHELAVIRRIKELLYEEGYTIAGAKKKLEAEMAAEADGAVAEEAEEKPPSPVAGKKGAARGRALPVAEPDGTAAEYRRGIKTALGQAREILEVLQSGPAARIV